MAAAPTKARPDQLEDAYQRFLEPMLERLQDWFPGLQGCEQDLYHAAWTTLLDGRPIEDIEQYLEVAVYRAGLKELRRRRRRPIVPLSIAQFKNGSGGQGVWQQGVEAITDRTQPLPEEQVESREDARLLAELLDELTPLQRNVVKLCWGCGVPRREAAELLGISERSAKRELLAAARVTARNAELARSGRWCEQKRGLIVAYVLGTLGPMRTARARGHLRRCPTCREIAAAVRGRMEGLAAVLPLPVLAGSPPSHGVLARTAELGDSIRSGISDLGAGVKEHAVGLFARSPAADTAASQVAVGGGLRGGSSAVAAVTACLVAGGGATYCAVEGVPESLRNLASIERGHDQQSGPTRTSQEQSPPLGEQTAPAATFPPPQPTRDKPDSSSASSQRAASGSGPQPSPAPEGSVEFGFESGSATSSRPLPAPAPASGGGEFTP